MVRTQIPVSRSRRASSGLLCAPLLCVLALACSNEGSLPPPARLNFPIALALSPDARFLYVANANFDLRYIQGSVQAYDVEVLNAFLDSECAARPIADRSDCGIIPTEDERDDLTSGIQRVDGLLRSEVLIGAYADGIAISDAGDRLYLPVRSEANLTFIDVDPASGALACDVDAEGRCADAFRRGADPVESTREIQLPADPVAVVTGPLSDFGDELAGDYVMLAHRAGNASVFFDVGAPRLVHTSGGFAEEIIDLAVDPQTRTVWMPSAREPRIARAGLAIDPQNEAFSFLFDAGALVLSGIDTAAPGRGDTRTVRFDPREEVRRAYVLSRLPRALLSADIAQSTGTLDVTDIVPVGFGPSRLEVHRFESHGDRTLAFVSCFDSRDLYVIDVDLGTLVGVVRGLGGPFELQVDTGRDRVYLLDFRSSVLRVIDLAPMFECLDAIGFEPIEMMERADECSPQTLGIVGRPRAVRELI